jgi:hypothetical protein
MGHILFGDGTYIRGTDSTEEPSLSFPLLKRGTLLPLFRHNFFGCPHIMRAPEAAQLNGFPMKGERENPIKILDQKHGKARHDTVLLCNTITAYQNKIAGQAKEPTRTQHRTEMFWYRSHPSILT